MEGYNGTIFAYGQTGSGKTFTMMGDLSLPSSQGLIPRTASEIFELVERDYPDTEFILRCSMLEIYKDTLLDLLDNKSSSLKIKECPRKGIHVQGLSAVCVTNPRELLEAVSLGEEFRTVASTRINATSSRSHLILIIEVVQTLSNGGEKRGVLNMVDLAGSEKVRVSGVTGVNLEEAKKINLSLSALGKVISALVAGNCHVPFRDSKLTRLLQESLGGNYKTTLVVNCSPAFVAREETLNSLNFAVRAKAIKNKVRVNLKESAECYIKTIEMLKGEIAVIRQEMLALREKSFGYEPKSSSSLRSKKSSSTLSVPRRSEALRVSLESPMTINIGRFTPMSLEAPGSEKKSFGLETDSINFSYYSPDRVQEESYNKETLEDCTEHKKHLRELEQELEKLREKTESLEASLRQKTEKLSEAEKKALEYYTLYHKTLTLINKDSAENQLLLRKNESLVKTVNELTSYLQRLEKQYEGFVESMKSKDTTRVEFYTTSNQATPVETHVEDLLEVSDELDLAIQELTIAPEELIAMNPYGTRLRNALESNNILSKDIIIFQLKAQVTQAGIINSNMRWKLEALNWKTVLLKRKYQLKQMQTNQQKGQILALEKMVDSIYKSFSQNVKHSEKGDMVTPLRKSRIMKSFNSKSSKKQVFDVCDKSFGSSVLVPSVDFDGELVSYKVKYLETSVNLQQIYNTQLKQAYDNAVFETSETKSIMEKTLQNLEDSHQAERMRWTHFFKEAKENCELELVRKQEEFKKLNEVLAEWINNFMVIQDGLMTKEVHRKVQKLIINTLNFYSAPDKIKKIYSQAPLDIS